MNAHHLRNTGTVRFTANDVIATLVPTICGNMTVRFTALRGFD